VLIAGDGLWAFTREQQWIWLRALDAMFSLGACRSLETVFEVIDASWSVGTSLGGLHTNQAFSVNVPRRLLAPIKKDY
jgi:hypothetical protein